MKVRICAILFCAVVAVSGATAQNTLHHYTVNGGLSQHSVTSVIQDSRGLLWIATFDGLNRFDGLEFKTYRHDPSDPNSPANNRVLDLCVSDEGQLWMLFANNMAGCYDEGRDRFLNYPLQQSRIQDLGNDAKRIECRWGHLIITGSDFPIIQQIDPQSQSLQIDILKEIVSRQKIEDNSINSVAFAPDGKIWLATRRGVGYVDNGRNIVYMLPDQAQRILFDRQDRLMVIGQNLFSLYEFRSDTLSVLRPTLSYSFASPTTINNVIADANGTFWVATNHGVISLDRKGRRESYLEEFPIRSIFVDDMGVVWCGALNGLNSINPFAFPVSNFRFIPLDFATENHVTAVCTDDENDLLWVGTRNGVSCLRRSQQATMRREFMPLVSLMPRASVSSLCMLRPDTLLAGTSRGVKLIVRDARDDSFRVVDQQINKSLSRLLYRCLVHQDQIWLSAGEELYLLGFSQGQLKPLNIDDIREKLPTQIAIMAINIDPRGKYLWLGYRGAGLYRVNLENREVLSMSEICQNELSSPYVWSLYFDREGKLWIGTDAGLNRLYVDDDHNFRYICVTEKKGLNNDKIESIVEDQKGNIWFGTSQGVVCYDPEQQVFRTFDHQDGFQSNNFTGAVARWQDGMITLGGINGVSSFYPSQVQQCPVAPQANILRFSVNNQNMDLSPEIRHRFRSQGSAIYFRFGSFYSPNPTKISYRYRLRGLSDEWKNTWDRSVIYSGLPAGHYTFELQSVTQSGVRSNNTARVEFVILHPVLLSATAIVIYVLILIALLYFLLKNYTKRKILDSRLRFEEQLFQTEKKATEEKLRFYTNMAHEIKTPLTLIQGPVCDIETSPETTPYVLSRLKLIQDNVGLLKELTEQILDFRQAVAGKLKLNLQQVDIMPGIVELVGNYADLAEKRGIDLRLESDHETIELLFDEPKLIRIINNLLSNAMKFSAKGDIVTLSVAYEENRLEIEVSDTGMGICESDMPHIFEQFYKSNQSGGSGIGLAFCKTLVEMMHGEITVHSCDGIGTTFILRFPPQGEETEMVDLRERAMTAETPATPSATETEERPVILLVEDNVQLNNYLADILRDHFFVIQNYDGVEALQTLHAQRIDLVITDIMMPRMDGITLGRRMRKFKNSAHIPIIYISAKSDVPDQIEGLDVGAIDYITKPFNPRVLVTKIQNILNQLHLSKRKFSRGVSPALKQEHLTVQNRDEIFIRKAKQIVTERMSDEQFGVNALSDAMGVSRVHLAREFNRIVSQTPSEFIRSIRLNRAKELLAEGNVSIKEVLWQIGIQSHSGFTRSFKKEFGYLPSEQHRKQEE